jgi:hypothetical protein
LLFASVTVTVTGDVGASLNQYSNFGAEIGPNALPLR